MHFNNCLVWFRYKIRHQRTVRTAERIIGAPPFHPPRTVCIQSEEKGSENHFGSFTSKPSTFGTFAIWSVQQSTEYQDRQAQEQFFPPGNLQSKYIPPTLFFVLFIFYFIYSTPVHIYSFFVVYLYLYI